MNIRSIRKIIKKNYKKIIIVCLIMLILSYKISENFSTTQALDAVKSTEKKVNGMFGKIDSKKATMTKQLHMDNILSLNSKPIRLKNESDNNHVIFYNKDIDGPEIKGWNGISLATGTGGAKRVVEIKKDFMRVNGKICINGTCIDENILKRLNQVSNPPRNKQGCYLKTEKPCSRQHGDAPPTNIWFRDNHNHASSSDGNCKKRVKDFNNWCGNNDFKYHFQK